MADEFDEELDREPEGSIITPIFLGCGAMGLGCLFSVGAIAIGVLIFFPGIFAFIDSFSDDPMLADSLAMLEANPAVVAAVGTPIEAELDDIDEASGTDAVNVEIGDAIELSATYLITGPVGGGRFDVVGSRELVAQDEWRITSLVVTLDGGEQIRVYPGEGDVPPPPAALAPPEEPLAADPADPEGADAAADEPASEDPEIIEEPSGE